MGTAYETVHKASVQYPYLSIENHQANFVLHFHEELEVLYLMEGSITVQIAQREQELLPGDICLILPGTLHTLKPVRHNRICIMKIYPSLSFVDRELEKDICRPADANYDALKACICTIMQEDAAREYGYALAMNTACGELVLTVLRRISREKAQNTSEKSAGRSSKILGLANAFLEEHYASRFSLEDIASACGYTKYYFSRCFHEITGTCFSNYCTGFRLEKAVQLLQTGSLSIEQVAYACGFFNIRSFYTEFKRHYKTTPGAYQKYLKLHKSGNVNSP